MIYAAASDDPSRDIHKYRSNSRQYFFNTSYLSLDITITAAYLIIHRKPPADGSGSTRRQNQSPQGAGASERSSRACACHALSVGRVLRRSRSGASQIRDVASGTDRGRCKIRSRRDVRAVAADILPGRGRVQQRGSERFTASTTRSEGRSQAHCRSDGLHRDSSAGRCSDPCPSACTRDQSRTGTCDSPAQHRTRPGAQKKTLTPGVAAPISSAALQTYETLRTEVIAERARPAGLCAVVHHGLLRGVALLLSSQASADAAPSCPAATVPFTQDRKFLHLVANMVLQAHAEVNHVY